MRDARNGQPGKRTVEELLATANATHGPGARCPVGPARRPHDHFADARAARGFLAGRLSRVPEALPSEAALGALRRIGQAVRRLVDEGEGFPQAPIRPLLGHTAFRLDDDGRLVATRPGWNGTIDGLLAVLATLSADDPAVKHCADARCEWIFYDRSRNHSRQWCEMATCGNRAKVARFAQRRRDAAHPRGPSGSAGPDGAPGPSGPPDDAGPSRGAGSGGGAKG